MRQRSEAEIKADIRMKTGRRQSTATLYAELNQAVLRRLKQEVRANRLKERMAKGALVSE